METPVDAAGFSIRSYSPQDYPMLVSWWEEHGTEPYPESILPPSGVIVERLGQPCAAGFLMLVEQANLAFFHGLVTAPRQGMKAAFGALTHLLEGLDIIMRETGRTLMLGSVPDGAMAAYAEKLGFRLLERKTEVVRITYPESHGS